MPRRASRLPARSGRSDGRNTLTEVLIKREGQRVVLEGARRTFSRRFLALAGSAADLPYPPEPPAVEPGPKLG
jgi:hypothetical protein